MSSICVELGASEAKIGCWIRAIVYLRLVLTDTELSTLEMRSLEVCWAIVLAGIDAALVFELWLSTKWDIAFVPIESLIETVRDSGLRLVARIHWSDTPTLVLLVALILISLQLLFIFLELLETR